MPITNVFSDLIVIFYSLVLLEVFIKNLWKGQKITSKYWVKSTPNVRQEEICFLRISIACLIMKKGPFYQCCQGRTLVPCSLSRRCRPLCGRGSSSHLQAHSLRIQPRNVSMPSSLLGFCLGKVVRPREPREELGIENISQMWAAQLTRISSRT